MEVVVEEEDLNAEYEEHHPHLDEPPKPKAQTQAGSKLSHIVLSPIKGPGPEKRPNLQLRG